MTLITIILCVICYFWVDRPVTTLAHDLHLRKYKIFYAMQLLPELFTYLAAAALVYYTFRIVTTGPSQQCRTWALIAVAFIVATTLNEHLKVVFGRYWTATWVDNNPSFIQHGAYGFNWFKKGAAFRSFPSGHSTAVFSVMTLVYIYYPKIRWLAVLGCVSVITGLLAEYFHFVSDIIAGAYLGMLVALIFAWSDQTASNQKAVNKN